MLGHSTNVDDWNVRISGKEVRLDNLRNENTSTFFIEDDVLFVEISTWSPQGNKTKSQNIYLNDLSTGWRDFDLRPMCNPSIEAIAYLEHLKKMEFNNEITCSDASYFDGMKTEDFNLFLDS